MELSMELSIFWLFVLLLLDVLAQQIRSYREVFVQAKEQVCFAWYAILGKFGIFFEGIVFRCKSTLKHNLFDNSLIIEDNLKTFFR